MLEPSPARGQGYRTHTHRRGRAAGRLGSWWSPHGAQEARGDGLGRPEVTHNWASWGQRLGHQEVGGGQGRGRHTARSSVGTEVGGLRAGSSWGDGSVPAWPPPRHPTLPVASVTLPPPVLPPSDDAESLGRTGWQVSVVIWSPPDPGRRVCAGPSWLSPRGQGTEAALGRGSNKDS